MKSKIEQQNSIHLKLREFLGIVPMAKVWKDGWSSKVGCI